MKMIAVSFAFSGFLALSVSVRAQPLPPAAAPVGALAEIMATEQLPDKSIEVRRIDRSLEPALAKAGQWKRIKAINPRMRTVLGVV